MADEDSTPEMEFYSDLGKLQTDFCLNTSLEEALPMVVRWGFSLQLSYTPTTSHVSLCHYKGHSIVSILSRADELGIRAAAEGLLGLPSALGCACPPAHLVTKPEPVPAAPPAAPTTAPAAPASSQPEPKSKPEHEPAPAAPPTAPASSQPEPATFDLEGDLLRPFMPLWEDLLDATPADPDPEADPSTSTAPLDADQKATIVAMLRALTPEKKRAANVSFRKTFNIPSSITSPSDAITEVRHLEYLQRLVDEAEGIPSP